MPGIKLYPVRPIGHDHLQSLICQFEERSLKTLIDLGTVQEFPNGLSLGDVFLEVGGLHSRAPIDPLDPFFGSRHMDRDLRIWRRIPKPSRPD